MKKSKEDKPLNRKLIEQQVELMDRMRRMAKINLVNCGSCGSVLLHKRNAEEVTCPYCEFTSDQSDFPDFIYDGMINNLCD
jgi:LSD1 subclass zinc finger protein